MINLTRENIEAVSERKQPVFFTNIPISSERTGLSVVINKKYRRIEEDCHRLNKHFDKIHTSLRRIDDRNSLSSEKYLNNIDDLKEINDALEGSISLLNHLYSSVSNLKQMIGERLFEKEPDKDNDFIVNTDISFDDDILHIKYPVLLPKKAKTFKDNGISIKRISDTYTASIHEYFKENPGKRYENKVVMCFIHHYSTENLVRDHDNYSLREVINALCAYVLTDDNPKWCAHYTDYIVDGMDYSEIYLVPETKFTKFLSKHGCI